MRTDYTYCSFASVTEFLGALILEGHVSAREAFEAANRLGVNPGGEMVAIHSPDDLGDEINAWHAEHTNRLLTLAELKTCPAGIVRHREASKEQQASLMENMAGIVYDN